MEDILQATVSQPDERMAGGEKNFFDLKKSGDENSHQTTIPAMAYDKEDSASEMICDKQNVPQHQNFGLDIETDSSDSRFACDSCEKTFKHRQSLRNHRLLHNEFGGFVCQLCKKSYHNQRSFYSHIKYKHVTENENLSDNVIMNKVYSYPCDICNKSFVSSAKLQSHLTLHTSDCQFLCDLCADPFHSVTNLKRHQVQTHGVKLSFDCRYCSPKIMFDSRVAFKEHLKSVHSAFRNKKGQMECQVCHKTFLDIRLLRDHVSTVHFGEKRHSCNVCSRQFAHYASLYQHKLTHIDERKYSCSVCQKAYKTNVALYIHKKTVHSNKAPVRCNVCNKVFSTKIHLSRHMRTHSNERKYACDKCDKSYKKSRSLKTHQQVHHTGIVSCQQCEKTFESQKMLRRHVRLHTGVTPFQCPKCELAYTEQKSLNRHLKSHEEENNPSEPTFNCEVCHALYSKRDSLLRHYRRNHIEYYKQKIQNKTNLPYKGKGLFNDGKTNHEDHCNNEFTSQQSEVNNPTESSFNCEVCHSVYSKRDSLLSHYRNNHKDYYVQRFRPNFPYKCKKCEEQFPQKMALYNHIKTNHEDYYNEIERQQSDREHKCELCGLAYKQRCSLVRHYESHKVANSKTLFKCEVCCIEYTQRYSLQNHYAKLHREYFEKHVRVQKVRYKCDRCTNKFSNMFLLNCHIKSNHQDYYNEINSLRPFFCNQCNRRFKSKVGLRLHAKTHKTLADLQLLPNHNSTVSQNKVSKSQEIFTSEVSNSAQNDLYSYIVKEEPMDISKYELQESYHSDVTNVVVKQENEILPVTEFAAVTEGNLQTLDYEESAIVTVKQEIDEYEVNI